MKEQKQYNDYFPTIWIDASSQEKVFVQSRSLQARKLDDDPIIMNQEEDGYLYTHSYGYREVNKRKEKYIKTRIQSMENSQMQMEQFIYRPSPLNPDMFALQVSLIEGKKQKQFISVAYNRSVFSSGDVFLYPYELINQDLSPIGLIESEWQIQEATQAIQEAMESGEHFIGITHYGELGSYTTYVPLQIDQYMSHFLLNYLNSDSLPEMEEPAISPTELEFYVDLLPKEH